MAKSICIYGPTGSRKTTQMKWLAHYVARRTGKATYLLSMDGGGWAPCQPEIDAGMIEPFFVDPALAPVPTLRRISQGYWPQNVKAAANQVNLVPMDWTRFGGVIVEGWTSIGAAVKRHLADKNINVGGEDRAKLGGWAQSIMVNDAIVTEHMRSTTRGDYGFVQNFIYGLVMNFNALPAEIIGYTALESKTEDDDRATVIGPAIEGKKGTAQCGAWIGDLVHAQDYAIPVETEVPNPAGGAPLKQTIIDTEVRFYFKKHPDPATGLMFPAKPRVTPERIKDINKAFPNGYFVSDDSGGVDRYLDKVDDLTKGQADSLKGWRERMDQKLGRNNVISTINSK